MSIADDFYVNPGATDKTDFLMELIHAVEQTLNNSTVERVQNVLKKLTRGDEPVWKIGLYSNPDQGFFSGQKVHVILVNNLYTVSFSNSIPAAIKENGDSTNFSFRSSLAFTEVTSNKNQAELRTANNQTLTVLINKGDHVITLDDIDRVFTYSKELQAKYQESKQSAAKKRRGDSIYNTNSAIGSSKQKDNDNNAENSATSGEGDVSPQQPYDDFVPHEKFDVHGPHVIISPNPIPDGFAFSQSFCFTDLVVAMLNTDDAYWKTYDKIFTRMKGNIDNGRFDAVFNMRVIVTPGATDSQMPLLVYGDYCVVLQQSRTSRADDDKN